MKGISKNKDLNHLFMIPFSLCAYSFLCNPVRNRVLPYIVKFIRHIGIVNIDIYMISVIWMSLLLFFLILFCFATKQSKLLNMNKKHLGKGMKMGWYIFLYSAVYIALCYRNEYEYHHTSHIFFGVIYYVLVAVCEEIVFRGLILENLYEYLKNKTSNNTKSVNISILFLSLLFALSHFSNIGTFSKRAVMIQIFGAFVYGALFAIITLKTESLLSAIILHAVNDISSAYSIIILKTGKNAADVINGYGLTDIIALLPVAVYLLYLGMKSQKCNLL